MGRWTDTMKLSKVYDFHDTLHRRYGVYELGFMRGNFFYPKYIGRARNPALTEAQLLYEYEIGWHGGLYEWNQRYEYSALRQAGWLFADE